MPDFWSDGNTSSWLLVDFANFNCSARWTCIVQLRADIFTYRFRRRWFARLFKPPRIYNCNTGRFHWWYIFRRTLGTFRETYEIMFPRFANCTSIYRNTIGTKDRHLQLFTWFDFIPLVNEYTSINFLIFEKFENYIHCVKNYVIFILYINVILFLLLCDIICNISLCDYIMYIILYTIYEYNVIFHYVILYVIFLFVIILYLYYITYKILHIIYKYSIIFHYVIILHLYYIMYIILYITYKYNITFHHVILYVIFHYVIILCI